MGLVLAPELLLRLLSTVDTGLLFEPNVIVSRKSLRQAWLDPGRHDGTQPGLTVGALDLNVAVGAAVSLLTRIAYSSTHSAVQTMPGNVTAVSQAHFFLRETILSLTELG